MPPAKRSISFSMQFSRVYFFKTLKSGRVKLKWELNRLKIGRDKLGASRLIAICLRRGGLGFEPALARLARPPNACKLYLYITFYKLAPNLEDNVFSAQKG